MFVFLLFILIIVQVGSMRSSTMADLLNIIEQKALSNRARVAIGVREPTADMLYSAEDAHSAGYAEVILVGNKDAIDKFGTSLEVVDTNDPETVLGDLLVNGYVDASVRGNAKASATLSHLISVLGMERLYRMAFLLTDQGHPFFLAPVGIDEGNNIEDKIKLIRLGAECIRKFGIEPAVGILSGGRWGDLGRDETVDRTLLDADTVTERVREMGVDACHYTILIEDAIRESNLIIAPDGISGNLIFRTLVFLGGGVGIGAPVLMDKHVFVDTSRVSGNYTWAIMLASALVNMKYKDDQ